MDQKSCRADGEKINMSKDGERLDREFRHLLRRCPKLSDAEFRLLGVVASYSKGTLITYAQICAMTNWSKSKLKRTVSSLVKYKLIERTYGQYKKVKLKIAPARIQLEFAQAHDGSLMSHQSKPINEPTMAHPRTDDSSSTSQPILEKELERKLESNDLYEIERRKAYMRELMAKEKLFQNLNYEAKDNE